MTDHTNYELRRRLDRPPAELWVPLADLLDALDRWEYVGSDSVMDEWLKATPGLRQATQAMREAVRALPPPTAVRAPSALWYMHLQPPTNPLEEIARHPRVNEATMRLEGYYDHGGTPPETAP